MQVAFTTLLHVAMNKHASDIHFIYENNQLKVTMRCDDGVVNLKGAYLSVALFQYIKYIAGIDLGYGSYSQSTSFQFPYHEKWLSFRFSLISILNKETAVLRILNQTNHLTINNLSYDENVTKHFLNWSKLNHGLIVLSGPTGSGKTTTLHAILSYIANHYHKRVVSLEDPVEIIDDSYLQLQVNESGYFTYEKGIRELMRHDPDVIMIGEVRDETSAKMLLRAALSGHLVFTTIHAKNAIEVIHRFIEFGLNKDELLQVLSGITSQRIFNHKNNLDKICLYEIAGKEEITYYEKNQCMPKQYQDMETKINQAIKQGLIDQEKYFFD